MAEESSDRGGFSRGFGRGGDRGGRGGDRGGRGGDRGGRGRGGGRGGRGGRGGKDEKDVWTPCTKLGRLVQAVRFCFYIYRETSWRRREKRARDGCASFGTLWRDVLMAFLCGCARRDVVIARDFRAGFFLLCLVLGPKTRGLLRKREDFRNVLPVSSMRRRHAHQNA